MVDRIAIIGAGIAGLCTAKVLLELGYEVTLFEKEADLGGVWSSSRRYPGLTTQNPRETYCFSDWPMPKDYPEWPNGTQMQAYLQSYADHFGVTPNIHFSRKVLYTEPLPDEEGWELVSSGPAGEQRDRFDWLIACNGIFSIPSIPAFPGTDAFLAKGGKVLHTSQLTDPSQARDKHVLIVGYGKSSCDVANAVAPISASSTMVVRHLIWKIPKRIGNVLNFKHLFLNRLGEGLFPWRKLKGFEAFLHGRGKFFRNCMLASVQAVITRQLGLKKVGLDPGTPLETIGRSTVSLVSDGFYDKIANGTISFERETEIVELSNRSARISNGKSVPADIIICGTGWHQQVDFLPEDIRAKVTDKRGNFRLYRSMIPLNVPRLLFNGYNSSFFSQLNAEIGAIWLAAYLRGQLTLPSIDLMSADIDSRLAWMDDRTDGKHCKGTNIVPFSIHHIDELLNDLNLELPRSTRILQWIRTVRSADFAIVGRRFAARQSANKSIPKEPGT